MKYYPVIIPTLCRYEHFVRCIESLSNCTLSEQIDCYVGLDYPLKEAHRDGYENISKYLESCQFRFHKLVVIKREENYGAIKNFVDLRKFVMDRYDSYIETEDDNEFSPCFLEYMIKCLEKYREDDRVYSICGYSMPAYKDLSDRNIIFTLGNSAYGTAYWTNKQRKFLNLPKEYYKDAVTHLGTLKKLYSVHKYFVFGFTYCLLHDRYYDDGMYSCYSYLENKYQIKPRISLVRNWGNDGSGLHSGYDPFVSKREISYDKHFEFEPNEPVELNVKIIKQMEKEAASKKIRSRIHQEVGAIMYPLVFAILRKFKLK